MTVRLVNDDGLQAWIRREINDLCELEGRMREEFQSDLAEVRSEREEWEKRLREETAEIDEPV